MNGHYARTPEPCRVTSQPGAWPAQLPAGQPTRWASVAVQAAVPAMLAGAGGTDLLEAHPDEHPSLVDHGAPVVLPVGVLA